MVITANEDEQLQAASSSLPSSSSSNDQPASSTAGTEGSKRIRTIIRYLVSNKVRITDIFMQDDYQHDQLQLTSIADTF